jgi:hypothetical protein
MSTNMIGAEYVLVRKAATGDTKSPSSAALKTGDLLKDSPNNDEAAAVAAGLMPQQPLSKSKEDDKQKPEKKLSLPKQMRAGKGSKGMSLARPIEVKLVQNFFTTSAAGATNAAVYSVSPATSQDFSSFAAVYDEVRVKKVEVQGQLSCNTAVVGTSNWAFAIDHDNPAVLASVADVLTFQSNSGPYSIGGSSVNVCPGYITRSQFIKCTSKLHPGRATGDGTAANLVGGGWVSTAAATVNIACYVKLFCQGVGAGQSSLFNCYVTCYCEFRQRQ